MLVSNRSTNVCFSPSPSIQQREKDLTKGAHFVKVASSQLKHIKFFVVSDFCEAICEAIKSHKNAPVIVCPEDGSMNSLKIAILLFGAYQVVCKNFTVAQLLNDMKDDIDKIAVDQTRAQETESHKIKNYWNALERARRLQWMASPSAEDIDPILDMEMAAHYAQPANGNLHVLIPGKLLLCPTPAPLPPGQDWADESRDGQAATRRFSAGFLGALLADLGASAVAGLGRVDGAAAAALGECELDVHDLGLDLALPALLPALDRLLAVSRAAPGPVALCGGDEGAAGLELVGTLAAAWLMREWGFGEGEAAAWVGMTLPGPASSF
jgi:hypothetical protein